MQKHTISLAMSKLAMFGAIISLAGCQNDLRVTVEMIDPFAVGAKHRDCAIGGSAFQGGERVAGSSYVDAIETSIRALRAYRNLFYDLYQAFREAGQSESNIEIRIGAPSRNERENATLLIDKGIALLREISSADANALSAKVRAYAYEVAFFIEAGERFWVTFTDGFENKFGQKLLDSIEQHVPDGIERCMDPVLAWSKYAVAKSAGFGGFTVSGVHKISPGDPMYACVLKAKRIGEPFTLVSGGVSGDSTIIFVQESPTQMRVFSVDMDPRQLIQNVIYITDKVLQAATKYLKPLPGT